MSPKHLRSLQKSIIEKKLKPTLTKLLNKEENITLFNLDVHKIYLKKESLIIKPVSVNFFTHLIIIHSSRY